MGVSSIDCELEVDVHYVAAWGKLLFSESGHLRYLSILSKNPCPKPSKPDKQPAGGMRTFLTWELFLIKTPARNKVCLTISRRDVCVH
ncbi:hypothetical protein DPMN_171838 [Dreissena polymorpha]|uniref:Uncharacterized protein n=1 Tax=Dreissena polymorpha TaxID=45954 RepID=A0A9D4DZN2_DREPO|nr:hypothetical protein DPMN_171838 [Dreissena polymorpha]